MSFHCCHSDSLQTHLLIRKMLMQIATFWVARDPDLRPGGSPEDNAAQRSVVPLTPGIIAPAIAIYGGQLDTKSIVQDYVLAHHHHQSLVHTEYSSLGGTGGGLSLDRFMVRPNLWVSNYLVTRGNSWSVYTQGSKPRLLFSPFIPDISCAATPSTPMVNNWQKDPRTLLLKSLFMTLHKGRIRERKEAFVAKSVFIHSIRMYVFGDGDFWCCEADTTLQSVLRQECEISSNNFQIFVIMNAIQIFSAYIIRNLRYTYIPWLGSPDDWLCCVEVRLAPGSRARTRWDRWKLVASTSQWPQALAPPPGHQLSLTTN